MPDEALLQKISQRHQPALNELYGRYGQTLKAVIDSVVHEGAEAEDVLQEIFLQIWKEAHNYSPKAGKPLGWVVTIARRRAIDRLRRRQAYSRARDRYGEQVTRQPARPRKDAEAPFVNGDLRNFLKKRMSVITVSLKKLLQNFSHWLMLVSSMGLPVLWVRNLSRNCRTEVWSKT